MSYYDHNTSTVPWCEGRDPRVPTLLALWERANAYAMDRNRFPDHLRSYPNRVLAYRIAASAWNRAHRLSCEAAGLRSVRHLP